MQYNSSLSIWSALCWMDLRMHFGDIESIQSSRRLSSTLHLHVWHEHIPGTSLTTDTTTKLPSCNFKPNMLMLLCRYTTIKT